MSKASLTAEQRRVVDAAHGPGIVTVQAVAGSGKTHMLVERARALGGRGVKLEQILFVTFTAAARDTLRERLDNTYLGKCRVFTIHGLLARVLPRRHFTYDHSLVQRLAERTYQTYKSTPYGTLKLEQFSGALISAWMKFQMTEPELMFEHPVLGHAFYQFSELREAYKESTGTTLMGHDDVLIWGRRTLESGETEVKNLLSPYQVVIADEYQDVTPLQSEIIEKLAQGKHLMVVADPAQSIFGFMGSAGKSFLRLAQQVAPLRLSDNFRCPGTHLLAASFQLQDTQRLVPAKGFSGDLQVEWCSTHAAVLGRLAVRIAALSKLGEEINILVRWNSEAKEIVEFLRRRGYRVSSAKLATEQLFKDPACRSVLRPVLEVLKRRWAQEHPLERTMTFLGLPLTQPERVWFNGLWSSRRTSAEARSFKDDLSPGMESALRLWTDLHEFTGNSSALLALLKPYLAAVPSDTSRLLTLVLNREMSLLDLDTALQPAGLPSAREIRVHTIHSAKGKEFPCVVLAEFPQEAKKNTEIDEDEEEDWDEVIEAEPICTEEDRVCYVALTRSTRLLYAVLPATSNFMRALAPEQLKYIAHVQNLLARPHHRWSQADLEAWPRLAHDPALQGYLERYWWRDTDPATLLKAKQLLTDAGLPVPASWTSDEINIGERLEAKFRIRRIPFKISES